MAKNWRKAEVSDALSKGLRGIGTDFLFGDGSLRETVALRIADVVPNPHQPRRLFDEEELARLAESLTSVGQLCPILVRAHPSEHRRYLLIAGERRWRAAQVAGLATLSAHILPDDVNDDQIALIENLQRVNLSPLEEADGMQRLIDRHHYSQEEVGALLGRSRTEVNTTLTLRRLIPDIRAACVTSHTGVSKAVLLEVAKMPAEDQKRAWAQMQDGGLTVRAARDVRKGASGTAAVGTVTGAAADTAVRPQDAAARFLAGLPRLYAGIDAGLQALAGSSPAPETRNELATLRQRLEAYTAAVDRLLDEAE